MVGTCARLQTVQAAGEMSIVLDFGWTLQGLPANNLELEEKQQEWLMENAIYTSLMENNKTTTIHWVLNVEGTVLIALSALPSYLRPLLFLIFSTFDPIFHQAASPGRWKYGTHVGRGRQIIACQSPALHLTVPSSLGEGSCSKSEQHCRHWANLFLGSLYRSLCDTLMNWLTLQRYRDANLWILREDWEARRHKLQIFLDDFICPPQPC